VFNFKKVNKINIRFRTEILAIDIMTSPAIITRVPK